VACCVKHFPGHGDTHVDSHLALPTVDKSRAELDVLELRPFKALRDQAPAVMTAHIVYPQIDPEHPATLSTKILGDILRREWGYEGVVITDALMMKAIFERYGYARAAVLAIQAGADMILAQGSLDEQGQSIAALESAFARGELTQAQGELARARLDALARAYPVQHARYTGAQRADDDALMRRAWARGLTLLRGAQAPDPHAPLRVYVQGQVPTDGVSEAGPTGAQVAALFDAYADAEVLVLQDIAALDWTRVPQDGRKTIVASTQRARYEGLAQGWRPDLHLVLWNPFQALDVQAPTVITWGYADGALEGLKQWLEGRAPATAQSPVTLN